jgi:hypothetical protein
MSNDALITTLAADLAPVRLRSIAREALLLCALGATELGLFLGLGAMRPDMGDAIGHTFMWWKLGSLALLVALSAATAVRSFGPTGSPRGGLAMIGALAAATVLTGGIVDAGIAIGGNVAERLAPVHGLMCAASIIVLSLPALAMLAILMRRGASTHPEASALASGLAAGVWGAFVFAFCCPANDPLYVAVWYLAGCAVVAVAASLLLPRGFRL